MIRVVHLARIVGIAIGSLVIAFLAVSLVSGLLLGPAAQSNPLVGGVIVLLGGVVFAEIMRRERRRTPSDTLAA